MRRFFVNGIYGFIVLLCVSVPGCKGCSGSGSGSSEEPVRGSESKSDEAGGMRGGSIESAGGDDIGGRGGMKNGAPGAVDSSQSSQLTQSSRGSVEGAAKPTPVVQPDFSAKVTKIDRARNDASKYNAEVTFTSCQGRDFVVAVLSKKSGTDIFSERVSDIPDYYYAHTIQFSYRGDLSEVSVQVKSAADGRVLDRWGL